MKIVCMGGGPAGLYFGLLMKQQNRAHEITVVERNKPCDTFGWGVVFSDATMDNMRRQYLPTADAIEAAFTHWGDIELHFKGRKTWVQHTLTAPTPPKSQTVCSKGSSKWAIR